MSDRKAAMKYAQETIDFQPPCTQPNCEQCNLAAAFLEVEAELEKERKVWEKSEEWALLVSENRDSWLRKYDSERERAADLQARLDRVEAALVKYGRHFPLCNIITRLGVGEPKCGCDFDATMRAIAAAGGRTESAAPSVCAASKEPK